MKKPRAWQRMLSGRQLDLFDPAPTDIEIDDIARGLAFVARWNGQTSGNHPYSVAEHSLLVERIFRAKHPGSDPRWKLAALLHDAAEYVIGDIISPVKHTLGGEYEILEARLADAIHLRFGLPAELPARIQRGIKSADHASAWLEATQLAGFDVKEANRLFRRPKDQSIAAIRIQPLAAEEAREAFVERFQSLACLKSGNQADSTKQATRDAISSGTTSRRKKSANSLSGNIR